MRKLIYRLAIATVVPALGAIAVPSAAAAEPGPEGGGVQAARATLLAALQRDLQLSPAQAIRLLIQQAQAHKLNEELTGEFGADFAGSWIEPTTGRLNVAVSNAGRAGLARSVGADTTVVRHSRQTLEAIMADLDSLAAKDRAAMAAATAWSVDPRRNQVVVTVHAGQADAIAPLTARYGDAVGIEQSDAPPTLVADRLDGGDPYDSPGGGCSVGFNATKNGLGWFLTAGHCGSVDMIARQGGVTIGPFRGSSFPGNDFAVVRNDNSAFWRQGPTVFAYDGNPNDIYVMNGQGNSPVGTAVCKSGRTTGLTCGRITAKNETVTMADGRTVSQLTRHSACYEQGDSGGSNFSFTTTSNFAEGVSSLARLRTDGVRLRCLSAFGEPNVSWYQPIGEALTVFGLTLTTG